MRTTAGDLQPAYFRAAYFITLGLVVDIILRVCDFESYLMVGLGRERVMERRIVPGSYRNRSTTKVS